MVVLAKLRKVSTRFALSLTAALIPGLASGGSDLASLHLGLAQFALDTHDPAAVLRYTRNATTEAERLVRAKALLVTERSVQKWTKAFNERGIDRGGLVCLDSFTQLLSGELPVIIPPPVSLVAWRCIPHPGFSCQVLGVGASGCRTRSTCRVNS
jgi:hypothetical protein